MTFMSPGSALPEHKASKLVRIQQSGQDEPDAQYRTGQSARSAKLAPTRGHPGQVAKLVDVERNPKI